MSNRGDRIVCNETKHVRKLSTWEEIEYSENGVEQLVSHLGGGEEIHPYYYIPEKNPSGSKFKMAKVKTIKYRTRNVPGGPVAKTAMPV